MSLPKRYKIKYLSLNYVKKSLPISSSLEMLGAPSKNWFPRWGAYLREALVQGKGLMHGNMVCMYNFILYAFADIKSYVFVQVLL